MEIYLDPEEKITCPYNNSHHIRRKRMNVHLTKCKMSYPESPLVECDFNVNHKIPLPELQYHHERCSDRKKMEIAVYQDDKTDLNKFPVVNVHVPVEETWDNDNVTTYDPQKYCASRNIIRHKDVIPAAQRRNFRIEERKRLAGMHVEEKETTRSLPSNSRGINIRDLPVADRKEIDEETPDSIAEIVQRIRFGANSPFISKT